MSQILINAISEQRALIKQMNDRALADIEWFKNRGEVDGASQELGSEIDSGEANGTGTEQSN
ncbi:MAG: hypothetical protein QM501_01875 [Gimesia sp.]